MRWRTAASRAAIFGMLHTDSIPAEPVGRFGPFGQVYCALSKYTVRRLTVSAVIHPILKRRTHRQAAHGYSRDCDALP